MAEIVGGACSSRSGGGFALLSDDIVLNIFVKLEGDPRDWARLACVSARFSALVRGVCYRVKCARSIPSVIYDLHSSYPLPPISSSSSFAVALSDAELPPAYWAALHKLSVCCPGLLHAGVLLENSDFGLEREIGPDENYRRARPRDPPLPGPPSSPSSSASSSSPSPSSSCDSTAAGPVAFPPSLDCGWSLFDDLYLDTVYDHSESLVGAPDSAAAEAEAAPVEVVCGDLTANKKRRRRKQQCEGPVGVHPASGGAWDLSREQGNKLLASRFRGDCLYICRWPGCVHTEEKRKYMLFRGVFKNFKKSRVWRTINDTNRSKIGLRCAFCPCRETWDLHSAFCLRRVFGFHDDGEPVVRAYVCDNGHVSGAWTERPMYT